MQRRIGSRRSGGDIDSIPEEDPRRRRNFGASLWNLGNLTLLSSPAASSSPSTSSSVSVGKQLVNLVVYAALLYLYWTRVIFVSSPLVRINNNITSSSESQFVQMYWQSIEFQRQYRLLQQQEWKKEKELKQEQMQQFLAEKQAKKKALAKERAAQKAEQIVAKLNITGASANFNSTSSSPHRRQRRGTNSTLAQRQLEDTLFVEALQGMGALMSTIIFCVILRLTAGRYVGHPTTTQALRQRLRERQRERFQTLVRRLNASRAANGERPISAESLRLVLSDRNFTGDDYESLLQFNEENGHALESILHHSIGATDREIERCPAHTIQSQNDYLLQTPKSCSVCLERYEIGDEVRTIPCFHTFHTHCIDPWLRQKAECPVCKHSAIG